VWHVPGLVANLFLAHTATCKEYYICMHGDVCTIHRKSKLVTSVTDINGIYCLDAKVVCNAVNSISNEFALATDIQL
jgi:hypothetical protein